MKMNLRAILLLLIVIFSCNTEKKKSYTSWPVYGGSTEMIRYSSLTQIDTNNVSQLKLAWTYSSADVDTAHHSQIQCNPIIVDGILYGVSPQMKLFAIDAATGIQKWIFDANSKTEFDSNRFAFHSMINSRGVVYWTDGKEDKRIFFTAGSHTFAIDALTGKRITTFGTNGSIDLHEGLDRDVNDLFVVNTSPGTIYKDLLILGTRVDEAPPSAPGHLRAYDVRTGKQQWIFHTIPHPGEYGYDTWEDSTNYKHIGGANSWSGFALDAQRGILFAPTGSAAYDFYGGKRKGSNLIRELFDCVGCCYRQTHLAFSICSSRFMGSGHSYPTCISNGDLQRRKRLMQLRRQQKQVLCSYSIAKQVTTYFPSKNFQCQLIPK